MDPKPDTASQPTAALKPTQGGPKEEHAPLFWGLAVLLLPMTMSLNASGRRRPRAHRNGKMFPIRGIPFLIRWSFSMVTMLANNGVDALVPYDVP